MKSALTYFLNSLSEAQRNKDSSGWFRCHFVLTMCNLYTIKTLHIIITHNYKTNSDPATNIVGSHAFVRRVCLNIYIYIMCVIVDFSDS